MRVRLLKPAVMSLLTLFLGTVKADVCQWSSSSGLLPDQACADFELFSTTNGERPILSNGSLRIADDTLSEQLFYIAQGEGIALPEIAYAEFGMRYVSGTFDLASRRAAAVSITTLPSIGSSLYIGKDQIFLLSGLTTIGSSATVDTDDTFHAYRMEISGKTAGSLVKVWQDGQLVLTGQSFSSTDTHGNLPRVIFGELSIRAAGVSEWTYFNTSVVPEPESTALGLIGLLTLAVVKRRRASR